MTGYRLSDYFELIKAYIERHSNKALSLICDDLLTFCKAEITKAESTG